VGYCTISEKGFILEANLTAQSLTFLWDINLQGLYTFVDPMVETILGYRPGELIGKKTFLRSGACR
jgi:PAS domain-containing protein